jgi:predicted DNA-binding transcriptional regulator YafY
MPRPIRRNSLSIQHSKGQWILSFGRHAEVLKPATLREEIALELKELLDVYQDRPARAGKEPKR